MSQQRCIPVVLDLTEISRIESSVKWMASVNMDLNGHVENDSKEYLCFLKAMLYLPSRKKRQVNII